jgi:hypothetical protein
MTGGGERSLDAISINDLADGYRAIVSDENDNFIYFEFNSTSTGTENVTAHPFKVRPDNYVSQGYGMSRWVWLEVLMGPLIDLQAIVLQRKIPGTIYLSTVGELICVI